MYKGGDFNISDVLEFYLGWVRKFSVTPILYLYSISSYLNKYNWILNNECKISNESLSVLI